MESICFNCESREFAHRIEECARNREDVTLWGVDYTPLPVDADGVPIHVGDVMENISSKQHAKACYMQMGPSGTWAVGLTQDCHWYDTESLRHRAPTVEDVLEEFSDELWNSYCIGGTASDSGVRELKAKYAAKLRLAGDE